jgi:hypothetical protein
VSAAAERVSSGHIFIKALCRVSFASFVSGLTNTAENGLIILCPFCCASFDQKTCIYLDRPSKSFINGRAMPLSTIFPLHK